MMYTVRRARPDEVDAVGALTVSGYDADGHLVKADGTYDHEYAGWLADGATRTRDGVLLVAMDPAADAPLGTITWCPPGSPFRELSTRDDQGEIRTLSVGPHARGRGVGSALVDWCVEEACATGLHEILLCSLPKMTTAHRLYASRGFVRRHDLDWSPHPGVDLWGFSLDLDGRLGA